MSGRHKTGQPKVPKSSYPRAANPEDLKVNPCHKKCYATVEEAQAALKALKKARVKKVPHEKHSYWCEKYECYHLTKQTPWFPQQHHKEGYR